MQMQVQVPIDVVQRQAGMPELLKLRADFGPQLFAEFPLEKIPAADARRAVAEFASSVDQAGNCFRRQGRMAAEQGQVQPHAQSRMLAGQGDGLFEGRLVNHQAGAGQDAVAVGVDDGLVDGGRAAEVVGVDDEAPLAGGRGSVERGGWSVGWTLRRSDAPRSHTGVGAWNVEGGALVGRSDGLTLHALTELRLRPIVWRHGAGGEAAPGAENEKNFLAFV